MNKISIITFLLLICFTNSFCQQPEDTIYGKIKSIREKMTFIKKKENYKSENAYGDYGHTGWGRVVGKKSRFNLMWYNTPFVHYINYYKKFDKNNNLILEEWYFKNQNIVASYENKYNELGDLILQKITNNQRGAIINDYDEYSVLYSYDENKNNSSKNYIFR